LYEKVKKNLYCSEFFYMNSNKKIINVIKKKSKKIKDFEVNYLLRQFLIVQVLSTCSESTHH